MAIARLEEILQKGAGKRAEQAYAGILLARQGLFRSEQQGRIIYVAENILGTAYPDDYKLPKQLREIPLSKNCQAYVQVVDQYLAIPNRKGQKPDLKPLADMEMEASALYTAALINYVTGHNADGARYADLLVTFNPKSPFVGWGADMLYQLGAKAGQWASIQVWMKAMLAGGNTAVAPEGQIKDQLCAAMINEAVDMAGKKQYGDALAKLSLAGQTCPDNTDRAGEAYYRLGETAEAAGFLDQAREAYKKVLTDYGRSKHKSMAQRRYDKIKNK
jgi:tetratricopeptide (TPR) repeat protein